MNLVLRSRRLATIMGAIVLLSLARPVIAQDFAETHLAAARAAMTAMRATEEFDSILPSAAQALKNELIQKNPDLQATIIEVVDQTTLALAARRADLEREAALAYARVFDEAALKEIAAFYESPTGQKLITDGLIVAREIYQAADIWRRGVARDLAQQVGAELEKRYGSGPEGVDMEGVDGGEVTEEGAPADE